MKHVLSIAMLAAGASLLAACGDNDRLVRDEPLNDTRLSDAGDARTYPTPTPGTTPRPDAAPSPNMVDPTLDPNSVPPPIPGVNDQAPTTIVPPNPGAPPPVAPN